MWEHFITDLLAFVIADYFQTFALGSLENENYDFLAPVFSVLMKRCSCNMTVCLFLKNNTCAYVKLSK